MLTRLSLRLRVLLFFGLLGLGGLAVVALALVVGHGRVAEAGVDAGFTMAGIIAGFGILGLTAGIWLLFDENVAKPIERLAAQLRTRAHAGVDATFDTHSARYLGDLAPAAEAVSTQLVQSTMDTAEAVALETAHLAKEAERLTSLLSEIPVAMVLINPAHQIVLYDAQAGEALAQIHAPRLNASIFDYFCADTIKSAHDMLQKTGQEVAFEAHSVDRNTSYDARLKPLGHAPGYMLLLDHAHTTMAPEAARPIIYDFSLMEDQCDRALEEKDILSSLTYVVFDTETTGLLPHKDEIVQIGAVRVVNGRIVPGEQMDQLVNPGMPIPPASTKVHGVDDLMVATAPTIHEAARSFHTFARDSVIVAHNAPFDMAFLRRHGKTSGLDWDHPILDTVLLSAVLFGASEVHTLDALCDRLGVVIPEALRHTALGDAHATAEVLCKMLPMLKSRGFDSFGQVIEQTRKHGRLLEDLN